MPTLVRHSSSVDAFVPRPALSPIPAMSMRKDRMPASASRLLSRTWIRFGP